MSILQTIDLKKYYGNEPNIIRALITKPAIVLSDVNTAIGRGKLERIGILILLYGADLRFLAVIVERSIRKGCFCHLACVCDDYIF